MATIAHNPTTPGAAVPKQARRVNQRAFLAGGTATSALIAAALVLFAALGTYVAFNRLPGAADAGGAQGSISIAAVPGGSAPEAAAIAAAPAPAAVAAAPAAPTALAPIPASVSPGTRPETRAGVPPGSPALDADGTVSIGELPPAPAPARAGALGGAVRGLEHTTRNLGIQAPLDDATKQLSGPLDKTLNDTLNGIGGLVGNPGLGDRLARDLNETTNAVLGPGGIADQILNPN